jgi:putative phosphoribosyl transferase
VPEHDVVREVEMPPHGLKGGLGMPAAGCAVVLFAQGSGSSRLSPRNLAVAAALRRNSLGTLLFDLLTATRGFADVS